MPPIADHSSADCPGAWPAPKHFTPAAHQAMRSREWPGNVRELLNLVETLMLVVDGDTIDRRISP